MTRTFKLTTSAAFLLAALGCQADAVTRPQIETVLASAAWDEKVNGSGLFDAGKWTDISISASATSFESGDKGMVQYSRTHADGDLDMHIDVQCLSVAEDGMQAAMAGPLKVQVNTDPTYSNSNTYVDGAWWRFHILTGASGAQTVRIHTAGVTPGTCELGGPTPGAIHTGEYRIRN